MMRWLTMTAEAIYAEEEARRAQDRAAARIQQDQYMMSLLACKRPVDPPILTPTPLVRQSKCDACGSREWVAHAGKEVCAYCRSDRA